LAVRTLAAAALKGVDSDVLRGGWGGVGGAAEIEAEPGRTIGWQFAVGPFQQRGVLAFGWLGLGAVELVFRRLDRFSEEAEFL
jgi:hypothetical protein